jgi:ribonuclease P protein component
MDCSFGRERKLKGKKLVGRIFSEGQAVKAYPLLALVITSDQPGEIRAGFSVSKKRFGKASQRNLLKRRMREAYRLNLPVSPLKNRGGLAFMLLYTDKDVRDFAFINKAMRKLLLKIAETFPPDVEQS